MAGAAQSQPMAGIGPRCNVEVLLIHDGLIAAESLNITRNWLASLSAPSGRPTQPHVCCLTSRAAIEQLDRVQAADQIWLFGQSSEHPAANAALTRAIEARMNAGAGVFATGDHDSLGWSLCGDIARVRQLRRWRNEQANPTRDNAPQHGPGSIDTLHPLPGDQRADRRNRGNEEDIQFKPVFVDPENPAAWPIMRLEPASTIAWLPDHPHEGSLLPVEAPMTDFAGIDPDCIQTVAWAMAWQSPRQGHRFGDPRAVPIVRTYDPPASLGHGRIVVDSTFHHWLDLNLYDMSQLPAGPQREPFRHWQAYAANIYEFLLPGRFRPMGASC